VDGKNKPILGVPGCSHAAISRVGASLVRPEVIALDDAG
jgi:hypothetical protein